MQDESDQETVGGIKMSGWISVKDRLQEPMVTHWMPLPEPPGTLIKEGDYEKQGVV